VQCVRKEGTVAKKEPVRSNSIFASFRDGNVTSEGDPFERVRVRVRTRMLVYICGCRRGRGRGRGCED